jgi:hypothetical protein
VVIQGSPFIEGPVVRVPGCRRAVSSLYRDKALLPEKQGASLQRFSRDMGGPKPSGPEPGVEIEKRIGGQFSHRGKETWQGQLGKKQLV